MTFGDSVNVCLKQKYATFQGRAARSEYWWFVLFSILVQIATLISMGIFGALGDIGVLLGGLILLVVFLGLIVPSLAVLVRRLHDTGHSGWWVLISFVPLVGSIVLLVFLVSKGTQGTNEYGADPL